jgi:hypothetical protein
VTIFQSYLRVQLRIDLVRQTAVDARRVDRTIPHILGERFGRLFPSNPAETVAPVGSAPFARAVAQQSNRRLSTKRALSL